MDNFPDNAGAKLDEFVSKIPQIKIIRLRQEL
jgi:hypothetical protein